MRLIFCLLSPLFLSACLAPSGVGPHVLPETEVASRAQMAVDNFVEVVDQVEPVAEQVCRERQPRLNCDFQILVESDPRAGINAFHTIAPNGRPLIIFSVGLIAAAENADELAFVLGHEAGHHIAGHLDGRRATAAQGARVFGDLARRSGANAQGIGNAAQIGSLVAARRYSQGAELEADALGALIAFRARYDAQRGATLFARLPNPPGGFLSTHPPNATRLTVVRNTVSDLRRSGSTTAP